MRKHIVLAAATAAALFISGCANMSDTQRRTATGAGVGAAAGAVLGAITGGGKSATSGAVLGAGANALMLALPHLEAPYIALLALRFVLHFQFDLMHIEFVQHFPDIFVSQVVEVLNRTPL